MKNCPKTDIFCQSRLKVLPNTKILFDILPKWQNFAKSGHTSINWATFCGKLKAEKDTAAI